MLKHLIALRRLPGIGNKTVKNLVAYCGSPEKVFMQKKRDLTRIPGIGVDAATIISGKKDFSTEEKEIENTHKKGIQIVSYFDKWYPPMLKELHDAPVILYYDGNYPLNNSRMIAFVGTRKATPYGKKVCQKLIEGLAPYKPTIVSGLAYGIDICAHRAALDTALPTISVLANGLDIVYPNVHKDITKKIKENGGILSEYPPGHEPEREHFPARNRIIAGMTSAVVVVETTLKGGATITAEIAFSYNRDVYAVPGNVDVNTAKGCNHMIKTHKAAMVESSGDIAYQLGWDLMKPSYSSESTSRSDLTAEETKIVELLKTAPSMDGDTLCYRLDKSLSEISSLMLSLEFKGVVRSLPGNHFRLR